MCVEGVPVNAVGQGWFGRSHEGGKGQKKAEPEDAEAKHYLMAVVLCVTGEDIV